MESKKLALVRELNYSRKNNVISDFSHTIVTIVGDRNRTNTANRAERISFALRDRSVNIGKI